MQKYAKGGSTTVIYFALGKVLVGKVLHPPLQLWVH